MQRISTTVVAVIGGDERSVDAFGQKANVAVHQPDRSASPIERAVAAWDVARRTHSTYFLHDADPLVSVADAWGRFFESAGPVGELEIAIGEALARWRARSIDLPDYYLVCSPENLPSARKHWYLGVLAGACSLRVVTATDVSEVSSKLASLPASPWWPDLDRLLAGIDRMLPDRAGLPGAIR